MKDTQQFVERHSDLEFRNSIIKCLENHKPSFFYQWIEKSLVFFILDNWNLRASALIYTMCIDISLVQISSQIKLAKFETCKTMAYFRLKNSLSWQETKLVALELFFVFGSHNIFFPIQNCDSSQTKNISQFEKIKYYHHFWCTLQL